MLFNIIQMSILLMNLLVGVAIDNVNGVADVAFIRRLSTQFKVSLEWEFLFKSLAKRWAISEEKIMPNKAGNPIMALVRSSGIVKRIAKTVLEQETKVRLCLSHSSSKGFYTEPGYNNSWHVLLKRSANLSFGLCITHLSISGI